MATIRTHLIDADKGVANGVASLDANIKVPLAQLPTGTLENQIPVLGVGGKLDIGVIPNGLDEIVFANTQAAFPATGLADTIYVDNSTGKEYLWNGSAYTERLVGGAGGTEASPSTTNSYFGAGKGIVLQSPDGTNWLVGVDNGGHLTVETPVP